jgi:O-6-methylguanine DNA methyltransferase
MTAHRLALSAVALGSIGEVTNAHADVRVEGTPMGGLLLLRCSGEAPSIDRLESGLAARFHVRRSQKDDETLILVIEAPEAEARMFKRLEERGVLLLPPLVWQDGRIQLRLISFEPVDRRQLSEIVPGMRLDSKAELAPGEVDRELSASGLLLPALTRRQGQAIIAAFDAGYYDAPRKVSSEEVAEQMGIARSTFEEHLKGAEAQLIGALAPVVRMRLLEKEKGKGAAAPEALRLYARFSEDLGLYVHLVMRRDRITEVGLSEEPPQGTAGDENPYLARIIEHISTGKDDLTDIPLDLPMAPFEREVLDLLRTIPPGEVVTYGELAKRLGRPKAARAVGQACAKNPAVIVVPCHRVVPSTGGLGNYSAPGGTETKRKLLEREGSLKKIKPA